MVSDEIKDRAIALAGAILESEEYKDFINKESVLKEDEEAQRLLAVFQEKQREFMAMQLNGEMNEQLVNELSEIQNKLNSMSSVISFVDSYQRFVNLLGEIGEIISQEIQFDFGEAYRG
ncbi:MAG: YlbF family regulator [Archaeoglobus sp.]|nr:MAG: YlbF family regulator [Archaeoglobus sp.]